MSDRCECCDSVCCSMQLEVERLQKDLDGLIDAATWFRHRGGDTYLERYIEEMKR